MKYIDIADREQGTTSGDRFFGYCGIDGRGGQFFTWGRTLAETLESIEDDSTDPPDNWPGRAYQEVRGKIRKWWASGYRGGSRDSCGSPLPCFRR